MSVDIASAPTAVVVGAAGGIGQAFVDQLLSTRRYGRIIGIARHWSAAPPTGLEPRTADLTDEASLVAALADCPRIDLALVATGLLHDATVSPEKSWRVMDAKALARLFAVNSIGPMLVAKHVIPRLPRDQRCIFAALSARVSSISDNRLGGWYGYRASKAALNQLLKTLAIELARTHQHAIVAGLHPGTVATPLSKPFQGNVPEGKLFTPAESAAHLLSVLERLTPADSGHLFAWDGERIQP